MHSVSRIAEEWEGRGGHMVSIEKRNWGVREGGECCVCE